MWLPRQVIETVERRVRIGYVDAQMTKLWNENRHKDELRLLTGWYWIAGRQHRQGFKTRTVAMRDAYYTVIMHTDAPAFNRPHVVRKAA